MKVFIDTNVLLDFLCHREKFYTEAHKVFALGLLHKHELVVSAIDNGCDCVVTRNKKYFEKATIAVFSPNDFLSLPVNNE